MTRIKVDIGCLAKLLKKEPIVKLVEELPDRESAELNYIYVVPKDLEGQDKKAYVLRPNRDKWDTIDLTPKEISVVGADLIAVDEEVTNENGDTIYTVRQSEALNKIVAQLNAVDTDLRNRVVVLENREDLDKQQLSLEGQRLSITNGNTVVLPEYDDTEVKAGIKSNQESIEQTDKNLVALQEHTDNRLTSLESKVDNDNQTLSFSEGVLTISGGNSVNIPDTKYDDTEVKEYARNLNAGIISNINNINNLRSDLDAVDKSTSNRLSALENKEDLDDQTLSITGSTLSISNGNSVELPVYDDREVKESLKLNHQKADQLAVNLNGVDNKVELYNTRQSEKDKGQDDKIKSLEEKTKNFITDAEVSKDGSTVKLTYTKLDGSVKEIDFEDDDTLALAYDDTAVKARIKALEDKPDVDTIYDDTALKQRVKALEDKPDKDEQTLTFTDSSRDLTISNGNTVKVPEHSLDTILRLEGDYKNNVFTDLKAILEVYYDGKRVTEGYDVEIYWRGVRPTNISDNENKNWVKLGRPNINSEGHIQGIMFSYPTYKGKGLEVMSKVTYKGLSAYEYDHLENKTASNNTVVSSNQQGVTVTPTTSTVDGVATTTYNISVDTSLTTGKSAYDLWKEVGNTGSVQDFLNSLKGQKGDVTDIGTNAVKSYWVNIKESLRYSPDEQIRRNLKWNDKTEWGVVHLDLKPRENLGSGAWVGRLPSDAPKPVTLIELPVIGFTSSGGTSPAGTIYIETNGEIKTYGLYKDYRYIADIMGYFKK